LRRSCGIVVRRRLLLTGALFAQRLPVSRYQGFSPLQPWHRCFVQHGLAMRDQRLRTPCADRLRERTKDLCDGRALSFPEGPAGLRADEYRLEEPGSPFQRMGLAPAEPRPRTPSTDSIKLARAPRGSFGHHERGARARVFGPLARPQHPYRELNGDGSRPDRSPSHPLDVAPRFASRLRLDTTPRCFEPASTTDASHYVHPRKHPLRRPGPERRG
jgi:hypothetical protein